MSDAHAPAPQPSSGPRAQDGLVAVAKRSPHPRRLAKVGSRRWPGTSLVRGPHPAPPPPSLSPGVDHRSAYLVAMALRL